MKYLSKEAGILILKSVMNDIDDKGVSTHSLLLKIMEAAEILDVSQVDKDWVKQELTGYEDQNEVTTKTLPQYKQLPHYRWVQLPAKLDIIQRNKTINAVAPFGVYFPCDFLEKTGSSIDLQTSLSIRPENLWERVSRGTVVVSAYAELPLNRIESIVKSIRGFVYDFVVSTIITSEFNESVSEILDNTRNFISSKLKRISEPLLEFINETLDSSRGTTEELYWRVLLENIRTILRRFTGLLLREHMTTNELPRERYTSKKSNLILDWCELQLKGKKGTELDALRKEIKILLNLINKPIHGEVTDTSRREVERILLKSLIWMAGVIDILDDAGYDWISAQTSVDSDDGGPSEM